MLSLEIKKGNFYNQREGNLYTWQRKIIYRWRYYCRDRKKYKFNSKNVFYFKDTQTIYSNNKSSIQDDNGNLYELKSFYYEIDKKILKGKDVIVLSKISEDESDKYYFSEGFFNFEKVLFLN